MERPLFSEMLATRRRELGYSIGQASRVLRLKEDVLIAFEEGDFGSMPKSGYAQGMLASYARYLGLDATEICDIYIEDLDSYRHGRNGQNGMRKGPGSAAPERSQSPSIGQPYVAKRGLLPTSGGMAGDLGSFATTRVRSRDQYPEDRESVEGDANRVYAEYPQGRPYTGRTPTRTGRERAGGRRTRGRGDIDTMSPNDYDYEDDLRLGRDVRSYEAASTGKGRRRPRRNGERQRPSVRRQARTGSTSSRRDGRRGARGGSGRRSRSGSTQSRPNRTLMLVVGAVAILSIIIVLTAVSCMRQGSDETNTVPVSSAGSSSQNSSQSSSETTQDNKEQASDKDSTSGQSASTGSSAHTGGSSNSSNSASTGKNNSAEKETSVSVSVSDGEVTWLEIECDGKSDVAETITGPWQKTYTVTDSMTIQAGETSAVAVVQNGRQLQFESITAGIGTLRIQGTKKTEKSSDNKSDTNSTSTKDGQSSESGKSGSASNGSDEGETSGTSGYTTIDGVTYDAYGNVVDSETSDSSTGGASNANANGSNGFANTSSKTSSSRSSGR